MKVKLFLISFLVLISSSLFAETWYIKSYKINPVTEPGGKVKMEQLKRGFQVEVIESLKAWKKIKFNNKTGWVHKLALTKKIPAKRISILTKKVNLSSKARKRASTFTSAAAARGLLDAEKSNLELLGEPDFIALSEVVAQSVQTEEATQYVSQHE